MTIEKNLRHAVQPAQQTSYAVTPIPDYRWIAASVYISSSDTPSRAQTWSASNGGFHLTKEQTNGPLTDNLAGRGVFFEGSQSSAGLRTFMSSSAAMETGISHSFVVLAMHSSSTGNEVPVGFSNSNNHYLILNNASVWATTAISASVIRFSHTQGITTIQGWRGNDVKNIIGFKFTGSVATDRTRMTLNDGPATIMAQNVAGFGAFKTGNSLIRFGRRSNALGDEAPYSGSIFDVLLYTGNLTNAETGSIITQLMTIWGIT